MQPPRRHWLRLSPASTYFLQNINRYETANQVQKKLAGHATFTVAKE
jgi:hypothetical protein